MAKTDPAGEGENAHGEDEASRPRVAKRSAQNSFTDLVEGIFYTIAMTSVGLFATSASLLFRPKTFVDEVKGESNPQSPLDLGAAAYFLASLIFFFLGIYYIHRVEVTTRGLDTELPQFLDGPINAIIEADVNNLVAQLMPVIAAAIVMAVGLRLAVFVFRGAGTFDMALRVCLYATGQLVFFAGVLAFAIGVGMVVS